MSPGDLPREHRLPRQGCDREGRGADEDQNEIRAHRATLVQRLRNGEDIDAIAEGFHRHHDVPPTRTIQALANVVKTPAESDDGAHREMARRIIACQSGDPHASTRSSAASKHPTASPSR